MKGYLLLEHPFVSGAEVLVESQSSENNHTVVFEDDTETGYFYALDRDEKGGQQILDALHIYETAERMGEHKNGVIKIIWSTDWQRCALVIDNYCHAIFDFVNQGGYNRNEFPPPNEIWTKGERKLTDVMVADLFK